jgi:hypothetical protein
MSKRLLIAVSPRCWDALRFTRRRESWWPAAGAIPSRNLTPAELGFAPSLPLAPMPRLHWPKAQ